MGVQKEREGDPQGLLMKQGGGGVLIYHSVSVFEISHNKNLKFFLKSSLLPTWGSN